MKDLQTFGACQYHLSTAKEHFASLTKKILAPPELVERIKADLESLEEHIAYEEVVIRISDVKVKRDNTWNQNHSTVIPDFRGEGDLDFGMDIMDYCVRTRRGYRIQVRENRLRQYCDRFGLYQEYGSSKFADAVKVQLERETKRRRKPLVEGETPKSRPRVFKKVENAKKLIEKTLLTLKLVLPPAEVETITENYTYDE